MTCLTELCTAGFSLSQVGKWDSVRDMGVEWRLLIAITSKAGIKYKRKQLSWFWMLIGSIYALFGKYDFTARVSVWGRTIALPTDWDDYSDRRKVVEIYEALARVRWFARWLSFF